MEYTTKCYIDKPIEEVIAVFEDTTKLKDWQRGLISSELIKGEAGEVGSKRRLKILLEGQKINMIETIIHKNLPHEWHGRYTSKGLESIQKNFFTAEKNNQTKWVSESKFTFSGWMLLISKVLPQVFKNRSELVMKDFKNFIENGISVAK